MIRQGLSAFAPLSSERIEAAQERHGHAIPEYLKYLHTGDVLADELVQTCGIFRKGLALTELLIEISPHGESQSLYVKMRSTYGSPALEVVSTHTGWHIPAVGGHHARRRSYVARRSQSRSWLSGPGLRRAGAWPPGRRRPGSGCRRRRLRDCPPVRSPVRRPCPGPARTPGRTRRGSGCGIAGRGRGPFPRLQCRRNREVSSNTRGDGAPTGNARNSSTGVIAPHRIARALPAHRSGRPPTRICAGSPISSWRPSPARCRWRHSAAISAGCLSISPCMGQG